MNRKSFIGGAVFILTLILGVATNYFLYRPKPIDIPQTFPEQEVTETPDTSSPQAKKEETREVARPDIKQFQRSGSVILKEAYLDFDGDGQKEVVFLDEYYSHLVVMLTFSATEQKWVKTILQEEKTSGYSKNSAVFDVTDLNDDGKEELLYRESLEGSGGFWFAHYFAEVDGKIESIALPEGYPNIIGSFLVTTHNTRPDDRFARPLPWEARYYTFDGSRFSLRKTVECFRNTFEEFNSCAKENIPAR